MLIAGSDDGVYEIVGFDDAAETHARRLLGSGPTMRLRTVDAFEGVFAATKSGLFHTLDGENWTDLGVPREQVYAVDAAPDGSLYVGTRPAHLYVADMNSGSALDADPTWRELDAFQSLPSRETWRLPRHENLAQVRDVHVPRDAPERVVVGVEVGGVHVSDDGGDTWEERRGADGDGEDGRLHDDVHELRVVGPDEYVAGTGFGLFRSTDAGRSWTRLDAGHDQRYFRSVFAIGDDIYAGAAIAHTATWEADDADPALFVCRDGETLARVDHPRPDEVVTGMTAVDGSLVAATHRGSVLSREADEWTVVGSLPSADDSPVSYTPLAWVAD